MSSKTQAISSASKCLCATAFALAAHFIYHNAFAFWCFCISAICFLICTVRHIYISGVEDEREAGAEK